METRKFLSTFLHALADRVEAGECGSSDWEAVAEIISRVEHKDGIDDVKSAIGYLSKRVDSLDKKDG